MDIRVAEARHYSNHNKWCFARIPRIAFAPTPRRAKVQKMTAKATWNQPVAEAMERKTEVRVIRTTRMAEASARKAKASTGLGGPHAIREKVFMAR